MDKQFSQVLLNTDGESKLDGTGLGIMSLLISGVIEMFKLTKESGGTEEEIETGYKEFIRVLSINMYKEYGCLPFDKKLYNFMEENNDESKKDQSRKS